jgi:hypothetical protein
MQRASDDRIRKQRRQQSHDGDALEPERDFAEQTVPQQSQQRSLQPEEECRTKPSTATDGDNMRRKESRQVRGIGCGGQYEGGENIRIKQRGPQQNDDGRHARAKKATAAYWQRRQHQDVQQIRKEQIPLEDGEDAHGRERIGHEEIVVPGLFPVAGHNVGQVVGRVQIHRYHQARHTQRASHLHQSRLCIAIG